MDTEAIRAIGGLWPIVVSIVTLIVVVILRKPLVGILERLKEVQFRRGNTAFSMPLESQSIESKPDPQTQVGEQSTAEPEEGNPTDELSYVNPETSGEWLAEMVQAFFDNDMKRGEDAYKHAQDAESNANKKLRNEALYLHLLYRSGDTSALEKLQDLAEQVSSTPEVLSNVKEYIGMSYELASDYRRAAEAYVSANEAAQTEEGRANMTVAAAKCLFSAGDREAAFSKITNGIGSSSKSKALSTLYQGLASLYEKEGNKEFETIALEKAIENSPNDRQLLFGAAYSYDEDEANILSLLHYNTLLEFSPDDPAALNNIGVVYGKLQMPAKQISYYKKAFERDNTLAAANIAYDYMKAGFMDEAMQILTEASQKKDVHSNVGKATSDIDTRKEAESERKKELLEMAQEQRQFLLSFSEAYFADYDTSTDFEGTWFFRDDVVATAEQQNDKLRIEWERGDKKHYIVAYVKNQGAKITQYAREDKYSPSKLADKGYAFLDQERQIKVMVLKDNTHTFLTLKRDQ